MVTNRPRSWVALAVIALSPLASHAGQIAFSHHEANAWVRANVFDGGPVVSNSATLGDPLADEFFVYAADRTRVGSFGALAWASAESDIVAQLDGGMRILVNFDALYSPSGFAGGDHPGGMAEGAMHSVVEFRMPVNTVDWIHGMQIDDIASLSGMTNLTVENVTRSLELLNASTPIDTVVTTLSAASGDLIRITSDISGGGSTPPESYPVGCMARR